jgi:hypothetical protein
LRSLVATSRALPGEVSTRMNALTDICSSSLVGLLANSDRRTFHRSRGARTG